DFFGEYAEPNNPQKNITNKRDASISDYKNYIEKGFKNDPEKRDVYMWKVGFVSDIIYNEGKLLSVMNNIEEDIGGVAGFGGLHYSVIDLETGRKLTLKDIFVPAFDVVLNAKLIDKVRAWHDIEKIEDMAKAGFEMEMIVPNENFYINSEGIGFYYNAYEIYELETRAFFPFKDIRSVLRKESPISHLFNK
ncbi:MAG TPA: hypothetical protein DCQ31_15240, partial [Bacteroidales bacterium]|nr:hypothetical protein [Bacteroidales bacterium]